jgi:sugar phosphate isomerase/epimerase
MRLGGPIFKPYGDPEEHVALARAAGYNAIYCPLQPEAGDDAVRALREAAAKANIVIAEAGAWSNPLSPDDKTRAEALARCKGMLDLAERIGARCCVNIAGSRGKKWDGPSRADLTEESFDLIVETVRDIIDAVKPRRTFYTLEAMPWMHPDSTEGYVRIMQAIDRPQFAVHFDPVNIVSSPQRYFSTSTLIREFVAKLGPHIRSCHAKDILLRDNLTVHLDEVRPGTGGLDYSAYLRALNGLDPDLPLMIEHLPDEEEYKAAAAFIRQKAETEGVAIR